MLRRLPLESPLGRIRWGEIFGLMVASWLVPALIHLIPYQGARPIGVYLLPAFWTVFVAVFFQGAGVGLIVALVTPAVSLLSSGLPPPEWLGTMTVELAAYALVAALLVRRFPKFWLSAPLAYVPAKVLSVVVEQLMPSAHDARPVATHVWNSMQNGFPGLLILLILNLALVKLVSRDADWDQE